MERKSTALAFLSSGIFFVVCVALAIVLAAADTNETALSEQTTTTQQIEILANIKPEESGALAPQAVPQELEPLDKIIPEEEDETKEIIPMEEVVVTEEVILEESFSLEEEKTFEVETTVEETIQEEEPIPEEEIQLDEELLGIVARIIYVEARGECYEGQVAVGASFINRLESDKFPDTVEGVLQAYAPIEWVTEEMLETYPQCREAATEALMGVDPLEEILGGPTYFFYNPKTAAPKEVARREQISNKYELGNHIFHSECY